jgi:hypothetical protein
MNKIFVKLSRIILLGFAFFFIFAVFNAKVWDPDFWWHLKTGEYIYHTKALPDKDPFAYTSLPKDPIHPDSPRIKFILTQYWLAQLLFYAIYNSFGLQGIIYMRALILTLLVFLVYKSLRREGAYFYISAALLIPLVMVLFHFTGERPQLFSFLFTFLLIFLIEGYKKASMNRPENGRQRPAGRFSPTVRYLLPVPIIMLVWANMHGGVILGVVIILGYICSETLKYVLKMRSKSLPPGSFKPLLIAGLAGIAASLVNPNGYNVVPLLIELDKSRYMNMIVEAKSPLVFVKLGYYTQELFIFLALVAAGIILFLINIRKLDITDAVLFAGLAGMSLSAARVIPFFVPMAILMITRYGIKTFETINEKEWIIPLRKIIEKPVYVFKGPVLSIVSAIAIIVSLVIVFNNNHLFRKGIRSGRFPEGAARFLKENRIYGNMYNPYVWGGYLIWALYPDYKVFIDGRALIEEIFYENDRIIGASSLNFGGIPQWKAMLDAYRINIIVTFSVADFSGKLVPLIPALYNDPEWHLVYFDNISLVFLRDTPDNRKILEKYDLPKEWLWNEVITEAAQKLRDFRANANYYVTVGDALFAKKSYEDALYAYKAALAKSPDNVYVKEKLNLLENMKF